QGQTPRYGQGGYAAAGGPARIGGPQAFSSPFGIISPAQGYALEARRHMYEFGTKSEHFGAIALASNHNAQRNPNAVMNGWPITMEDHQNSRMIVDPYHLYDCCLESDGAAALVVTSADRARSTHPRPAYIAGAAQGMGAYCIPDRHNRSARGWTS